MWGEVLTGTNTLMGFSSKERALSRVSRNSENPNPDFTEAATVKVFLKKKKKRVRERVRGREREREILSNEI